MLASSVTVIDYGIVNLANIVRALEFVGAKVQSLIVQMRFPGRHVLFCRGLGFWCQHGKAEGEAIR